MVTSKKTNNGLALQNQLPPLGRAKINKRTIFLKDRRGEKIGGGGEIEREQEGKLYLLLAILTTAQSRRNYNFLSFLSNRCYMNGKYSAEQ